MHLDDSLNSGETSISFTSVSAGAYEVDSAVAGAVPSAWLELQAGQ